MSGAKYNIVYSTLFSVLAIDLKLFNIMFPELFERDGNVKNVGLRVPAWWVVIFLTRILLTFFRMKK